MSYVLVFNTLSKGDYMLALYQCCLPKILSSSHENSNTSRLETSNTQKPERIDRGMTTTEKAKTIHSHLEIILKALNSSSSDSEHVIQNHIALLKNNDSNLIVLNPIFDKLETRLKTPGMSQIDHAQKIVEIKTYIINYWNNTYRSSPGIPLLNGN